MGISNLKNYLRMKYFALLCLIPLAAESHRYYTYRLVGSPYQGSVRSLGRSEALTSAAANVNYEKNLNSGDIIKDTRVLSNQVQRTLRKLAANSTTAGIVNRIINDKNNICLKDINEGIAGIETATKLVERAGNDIKLLIKKVKTVSALTDPATVVRAVADILRLVEPVVNKIAPESPVICEATPDEALGSLRSLGALVDELAYTNQLVISAKGRLQLKDSASTISAVTNFLTQLRSTFSSFKEICTPDKEYNIKAISAVGDLIVNLADMFGTLGGVKKGENIRKGKTYVNKIVAQLNKIDDLGLGTTDCDRPGDFSIAASTMEDLATIIDEVDIEELQKQLGVDLSFVFNP